MLQIMCYLGVLYRNLPNKFYENWAVAYSQINVKYHMMHFDNQRDVLEKIRDLAHLFTL